MWLKNSLRWLGKMLLLLLLVLIFSSPLFGTVRTKHFSAYGACWKVIMAEEAHAMWEHKSTSNWGFLSTIRFDDGSTILKCEAMGIGPFWTATTASDFDVRPVRLP